MSVDYGSYPMEDGRMPNRNPETGVRYGIARRDDLADWVGEESEAQYHCGCGFCGADWDGDNLPDFPHTCADCGEVTEDDWDAYSNEAYSLTIDVDGVTGSLDECGDLWIFSSPVLTTGRHCSPCAPGACTISPDEDGDVPCYGLPADWWRES